MKNELFVVINEKELLIEKSLVEYDFVPILFVCIDNNKERYLVLQTDFDEEQYLVISVNLIELDKMLRGLKTMREVFSQGNSFWSVKLDRSLEYTVSSLSPNEVSPDVLPIDGEFFELVTQDLENYSIQIRKEVLTNMINWNEIDFKSLLNICVEHVIDPDVNINRRLFEYSIEYFQRHTTQINDVHKCLTGVTVCSLSMGTVAKYSSSYNLSESNLSVA